MRISYPENISMRIHAKKYFCFRHHAWQKRHGTYGFTSDNCFVIIKYISRAEAQLQKYGVE
jgi:hypothetical protein